MLRRSPSPQVAPPPLRPLRGSALAVLCGVFLVAGCATTPPAAVAPSLAGNPRLPADVISRFFSAEEWAALADKPYTGYVILRGPIADSNYVKNAQVVEAYPDDARNHFAQAFAQRIKITPITIGSHVRPTARIYVVFYEPGHGQRRAVVFAEQTGLVGPSSAQGGDRTRYLVVSDY